MTRYDCHDRPMLLVRAAEGGQARRLQNGLLLRASRLRPRERLVPLPKQSLCRQQRKGEEKVRGVYFLFDEEVSCGCSNKVLFQRFYPRGIGRTARP